MKKFAMVLAVLALAIGAFGVSSVFALDVAGDVTLAEISADHTVPVVLIERTDLAALDLQQPFYAPAITVDEIVSGSASIDIQTDAYHAKLQPGTTLNTTGVTWLNKRAIARADELFADGYYITSTPGLANRPIRSPG